MDRRVRSPHLAIVNTQPDASTPSFSELEQTHATLAEAFFEHQSAVLAEDFDRAMRSLVEYRRALFTHMKFEEDELLPIYERGNPPANGKVEFFVHEHRKLLEFLDEARTLLLRCKEREGAERTRAVLALLDKETQIKHFAEHHEAREEKILFPLLDELAEPDERARLVPAFFALHGTDAKPGS